MIKTDKVVYRTRTQEEYDWLMEKLDEEGCRWENGEQPRTARVRFRDFRSDLCIHLENKKIFHACFAFLNGHPGFRDYEILEVSDMMENEKKTITDEPSEQEDKQQKVKKVVYTTEVYFE